MHWGLESFKSLFIFAALLIQNRRKPVKCRLAFRRSLINAGILQNFHEYLADFCLYDFMDACQEPHRRGYPRLPVLLFPERPFHRPDGKEAPQDP